MLKNPGNTVAMRIQGGRKFFRGVSKCCKIVLRETAVKKVILTLHFLQCNHDAALMINSTPFPFF